MNNLHLSEEAQNDLMEIKAYIEEVLLNLSAALATASRITKKSANKVELLGETAPRIGPRH